MTTPVQRYRALLAARKLKPDAAQAHAATRLGHLYHALQHYRPGSRGLMRFLRRGSEAPKGLYIHGDVGRGKSALMDLFFDSVQSVRKRRVHFNEFMAETHAFIHQWRNLAPGDRRRRPEYSRPAGDDPIEPAARHIAADATLLCLDEFQVLDVADAMILGRLCEKLFAFGTIIVLTTNTEPDRLYEGGLNRQLFVPFIALIKQHLELVELNGPRDYRLDSIAGLHLYNTPLVPAAAEAMDQAWRQLTDTGRGEPLAIEVLGRQLIAPEAIHGVARFSFDAICGAALGPSDYLALAEHFHTILIDDIPQLGPEQRDEARRFTLLIDTLYDRRVKVICSAAVRPEFLYVRGDNAPAFRRTASRMIEMQSEDYLLSSTSEPVS